MTSEALHAIRLRFARAVTGANIVGATVVFLLLVFAVPPPRGTPSFATVVLVNSGVFVFTAVVTNFTAWKWSTRLWNQTLDWALGGRDPAPEEREATLQLPFAQARIVAWLWALVALGFGILNALFSLELGVDAAVGIALGGVVTTALGFLLSERTFRPVVAVALADAVPREPELPGVGARTVLSWLLGTGVVLVSLALLAVASVTQSGFGKDQLVIAIIALSAVGFVVGLLMMVGLARSVAEPITALRHAVGRVEAGDLDQTVTVDDGSEIGLLQAGFNQMAEGLRERRRILDLFGRQVGEDVARHALEHGVDFGGEAREAAVLFVDLQGSTTLAATRDPADVVDTLNAFFAVVVDVVAAHGGFVNKFEGDAALCVFGAPLPDDDAATHALAAARAMNTRLSTEVDQVLAGIGVSAGRVVAGNIGAARRFEYTVIGDPVNEAARLTELAKQRPERVLASGAAVSRAGEDERARWHLEEAVELRGRTAATVLATPLLG